MWLMFLLPFSLPATTARAINLPTELYICDYLRSQEKLENKHLDYCTFARMFGTTITDCCDYLTKKTSVHWRKDDALSISPGGIFFEIGIMIFFGIAIFAYLLYRLSGWRMSGRESRRPPAKVPRTENADVAAERAAVTTICKGIRFDKWSVVADNLHKTLDNLHAVRGLSFALRPSECFGLLGVNGAGKTTTFRMLTGLIRITYGEAYMKEAALTKNPRKWQSRLGYCPQATALLETLTAYETLYLFGRLRGVPPQRLPNVAQEIIDLVGLRENAAVRSQNYSGGNKRKLCIAVALIGFPELVLLDEPYAGVDVVSRTRIQKGLAAVKASTACTVLLTSHSMEECEVSCDRLTIMVQGSMVCLGNLQHLKDKFGTGYRLLFILPDGDIATAKKLAKAVMECLPQVELVNMGRGALEFRMKTKLAWSSLFQKIEDLEKYFTFSDVLVSDNTLEQIFIQFAREGKEAPDSEITE